MYFHEFIYKSYSALLILLFFFVRDEQKLALALFLISHFIQNIWNKTTLPSLVSIQQAASEQNELFFLDVHLFFASVLGKELLVPVTPGSGCPCSFPKAAPCSLSPLSSCRQSSLDRLSWFILQEILCLKLYFRLRMAY